jgi:hypothetical protein
MNMAHEHEADANKVVRSNVHGHPILARRRVSKVSEAEKQAFLDHLAQCCNGHASAEAAGRAYNSFNRIRMRDSEFAADWLDALRAGHATIEALMIERAHIALQAKKSGGADEAADQPSAASAQGAEYALSMDSDQILRLLAHNQRVVSGGRRRGKTPRPAASEEEACAAILKKLKQLRKRNDAKDQ